MRKRRIGILQREEGRQHVLPDVFRGAVVDPVRGITTLLRRQRRHDRARVLRACAEIQGRRRKGQHIDGEYLMRLDRPPVVVSVFATEHHAREGFGVFRG